MIALALFLLTYGWSGPMPPKAHTKTPIPAFIRVAIEHHCYVSIPPSNDDDSPYIQHAVGMASSNCPYEVNSGSVDFGPSGRGLVVHQTIYLPADGYGLSLRNGTFASSSSGDAIFTIAKGKP